MNDNKLLGNYAKNIVKQNFKHKINKSREIVSRTQNGEIIVKDIERTKNPHKKNLLSNPNRKINYKYKAKTNEQRILEDSESDVINEKDIINSILYNSTFNSGYIFDTILRNCSILKASIVETKQLKVTGGVQMQQLQVSAGVINDLKPSASCSYDLGSASKMWRHIYQCSTGYHYFGSNQESYITYNSGNLLLDNTYETGAIVVKLGTNDAQTDFRVKNNAGTVLFKVDGTGCAIIDDIKICSNHIGVNSAENLLTLTDSVLTVNGDVSAFKFIMTSDKRLKKDIKKLNKKDIENKFHKLESVQFKWKKYDFQTSSIKNKFHYGLIAQNVQKLFPECVTKKEDGFFGIDYSGLTSVLISKVQMQDKELKNQEDKIENLEKIIKKQNIIMDNLMSRLERIENINEKIL